MQPWKAIFLLPHHAFLDFTSCLFLCCTQFEPFLDNIHGVYLGPLLISEPHLTYHQLLSMFSD